MIFRILGPLQLLDRNGTVVALNRRARRLLLGLLLLRPNASVPLTVLADALWAGAPPPSGLANLQSHLSHLRRLLATVSPDSAPRPQRIRDVYVLPVDDGELDATEFEQLASVGRRTLDASDPAGAIEPLMRATRLWHGRVLDGIELPVGFEAAAANLEESRLTAVEHLMQARLALGGHADVLVELRDLVEQNPVRERMWCQLIVALHRSGRQRAALEAYTDARDALHRELGVGPGAELRSLHRALVDDEPVRLRAEPPDTASVSVPVSVDVSPVVTPRQLPFDAGGFTGRRREMSTLDAVTAAGGSPLVVVTGMGGVGKTALAVRWAHAAASRFPDGQLFVDLRGFATGRPLRPIDALVQLLGGLGVSDERIPIGGDEAAALYRSLLAGKRTVVVLDNAHDAAQVRPLLPGGGTTVVVTGRERLTGLVAREGAHRITLDGLPPDEAHTLLRSILGPPTAERPPAALARMAHLCAYLPLALRIAATNAADGSHGSLDSYLETLGDDRLASLGLADDPFTAVGVTFDRSYDRLPTSERRLFRLLGAAPVVEVTPHVAAALVDDDPAAAGRLLNRLAHANLVTRCGHDRFTVHDLLRLYARRRAETEDPDRGEAVRRLLTAMPTLRGRPGPARTSRRLRRLRAV